MNENIYNEKSPIFLKPDGDYIQILEISEREKSILKYLGCKELTVTTFH